MGPLTVFAIQYSFSFVVYTLIVTHLTLFWMPWKHRKGEWRREG